MQKAKKLPYGVSDFLSIRKFDMYYVDKTMYLPMIEDCPNCLFFIRPRRFGKSSFISMMTAYYDKKMANQFDELFAGLYIHTHPTENRGKYQIMHLDFSRIGGKTDVLKDNFDAYCNGAIFDFLKYYSDEYEKDVAEEILNAKSVTTKLNFIHNYARRNQTRLFLIIDEYDNFTNVVLNEEGHSVYHSITHASGFYRDVFKVFKGMFERIFLTGVSPVTIDDLTSGFNIGMNISTDPRFNNMLGLSTDDVRQMFSYYKNAGSLPENIDIEQSINEIKPWYNNYCFAEECVGEEGNFNTDMVLYYLYQFISRRKTPKSLIDPNVRTDYSKLKKLLKLDKLDGDRKSIIKKIAEEGEILGHLEESFPAEKITDPKIFVSLLFYYGMLTIKDSVGTMTKLIIPNNTVRKQYYEYLLEISKPGAAIDTQKLEEYFYEMAFNGEWRNALQYIANAYKESSSVRNAIEGERNIQGFFSAMLSLCSYYLMAPEMEFGHGFCDIFLMPDNRIYSAKHSYIIELKYLTKKDNTEKAEKQREEAMVQAEKYASSEKLLKMTGNTQLHKIIIQIAGWELIWLEEC